MTWVRAAAWRIGGEEILVEAEAEGDDAQEIGRAAAELGEIRVKRRLQRRHEVGQLLGRAAARRPRTLGSPSRARSPML